MSGRHGRDHSVKWPGNRADLIAAYPVDGSARISIIGGASTPVKSGLVTSDEAAHWTVHTLNAIPVQDYLCDLNFFVYFHHKSLLEAFGMTVVEAMSYGCICILPENFKAAFGDAAVYCTPAQTQQTIREFWADPNQFHAQQLRARDFVDANASPEAYLAAAEVLWCRRSWIIILFEEFPAPRIFEKGLFFYQGGAAP